MFNPLQEAILRYRANVDAGNALPVLTNEEIRERLRRQFSFEKPLPEHEIIRMIDELLASGAVQTPHPRYFGLFNPDVQPICVAADAMVAAFNPQLAAFSHNPAANAMEQHVLSVFRNALGWPEAHATFTTGGSEANHSAVITALTSRFPTYGAEGAAQGSRFYVSAEAHHSFVKVAHACGIGRSSVRQIAVGSDLRMDSQALASTIREDLGAGLHPFAAVATAGTTAAGAIDPMPEIAAICAQFGLWYHVDAAWGGGALLSQRLKPLLDGIQLADSITIDAHKWFSVPMGAGMFFCKHPNVVIEAFGIQTSYMPAAVDSPDPYLSTMQWSRRCIGLKLFMAMAHLGVEGYERTIDHQAAMGVYLRERLAEEGYEIVNETDLPLVCFRAPGTAPQDIVDRIYAEGSAWLSRTVLSHHGEVLRACITNHRTQREDVDELLLALSRATRLEPPTHS